ncbi:MAG: glycosyltransferase family 9 protein [Candidatus Alcyoniella australis]|nr:glycosyltransferase family 9 protein [Candidatus Alcyoniella australis]
MRILIVKLGAVGDCVHTLYALHALRRSFPTAHIGWVVEGKSAKVVVGHPDLDQVHVFNRVGFMSDLRALGLRKAYGKLLSTVGPLREQPYDIAIDFQTLLKSGIFSLASNAPLRIGFDKWREGSRLFNNVLVTPQPDDLHAVQKYMALVQAAGAQRCLEPPGLYVPEVEKLEVDRFFAEQRLDSGRVVAINPAASWPTKRWDPERYGAVARELAQRGYTPLVIWGPGEEELAQIVAKGSKAGALIAPPTALQALAHLLSRCALYLGSDSGPMHIAAVMGTPVVALFGPSDPQRVGPLVEPSRVLTHEVDCGPCWKHECPDPRCINRISVEQVVAATLEILDSRP